MIGSQVTFRSALLDADLEVPPGLENGAGDPAGRRFSVYRNNVIGSLTQALHEAFPLVRKLLGGQTFDRLAAFYVRKHPPTSPLMMHYGETMPAFLGSFEPLAHIGYLPDCARLDIAMRRSYHAADTVGISPAVLDSAPEVLLALKLSLAPSNILLRSVWPIFDIWQMNTRDDANKPRAVAQDILITRPEFDPQPHLLAPGAAEWLTALDAGAPFGQAHEHALQATPDFDLAQTLTFALQSGTLTDFRTKDS